MPNVYTTRSSPSYDAADAELNDADESIVLSDLVRTGEASRLRRRGAMRIEHHTSTTMPSTSTAAQTMMVDSSSWESDDEARTVRPPRHQRDEYGWVLFCGGEEEEVLEECHEPFVPSLFPLFPTPSSSSPIRKRTTRRSNGCGALLHMRASPRARLGVWTAKTRATDAVVSLDASYFDRAAVTKIVRSACGCIREGVGCAVCGNPLGTRYKPCKTAEDGIFISQPRHPGPLLHPHGPRYWHDASSIPSSNFSIYTFFSSSVHSSPSYTFLERHPATIRPPTYSQPPPLVEVDASEDLMFSRILTSSPTQLSDVGEEEDRDSDYYVASNWPEFATPNAPLNPDGDDTPNSPDKSNEAMLFPER